MGEGQYRIVRLEAENVKKLTAVTISPDGNMIEITGANASGKSSTLDAIWYALGGKPKNPNPIRAGQQEAIIKLDLGTLKVIRKFTSKAEGGYTTSLVVETQEGARFPKPQDVLDALVGELAFDPLEFTRLKPADQFDILKRFVPNYDFVAAAQRRTAAFEARTDVSRSLRDLKSQVAGISYPEDTPDQEVDISALAQELREVGQHNTNVEIERGRRSKEADRAIRMRADADAAIQQAKDYRRLADEAELEAKRLVDEAGAIDTRLEAAGPLPPAKDASEITARIDRANITNTNVRAKARRDSLVAQAEAADQQVKTLTTKLEEIDKEKAGAIAAADIPVEGIGFADDYITLNGQPFAEASQAEQLSASIAIAIASNPRLRVIVVYDGALLDDDSFASIAKIAEEKDIQIWLETVQSDRPSAIIIEDGHVREEAAAAE